MIKRCLKALVDVRWVPGIQKQPEPLLTTQRSKSKSALAEKWAYLLGSSWPSVSPTAPTHLSRYSLVMRGFPDTGSSPRSCK